MPDSTFGDYLDRLYGLPVARERFPTRTEDLRGSCYRLLRAGLIGRPPNLRIRLYLRVEIRMRFELQVRFRGSGGRMRRYIAEFIGTGVLVFGGCGSAVLAGEKIGYAGIALAFGLALL